MNTNFSFFFFFGLLAVVGCVQKEEGPSGADLFSEPTVVPAVEIVDGEEHNVLISNSIPAVMNGDPAAGWRETSDVSRLRWESVFNKDPTTQALSGGTYIQGVLQTVEGSLLDGYEGSLVFEERICASGDWGEDCGPTVCLSGEMAEELWDQSSGCYTAMAFEVTNDLVAYSAAFWAEFDIGIPSVGYGGGYLRLECDFIRTTSQPYWLNPRAQSGELICSVMQITDNDEEVDWATGNVTRRE